MGSIFTIGKALVKRNLRMTVLVGIIFILCIGGMISALSIQMSTADVFDKIMDQNKAPHLIGIYSGGNLDKAKINDFLKNNSLVESYSLQPTGDFMGRAQVGKYDDVMVYTEEYTYHPNHDRISISKGKVKAAPDFNEIWVPTGFSSKYGVKVGDKIKINTPGGKKDCVISAIVFDTWYSSTMSNPCRLWVRSGQLSQWSWLKENENLMMSVRLKNADKVKDFNIQMDRAFPNLVASISDTYSNVKQNTNILNDIISMVLLMVSILLVFISAGIIFFVISGEVINDYTSLGVYKGLGFSNRKLKAFNFCRYALLLLLTVPVGFGIGLIVTKGVISQYQKTVGDTGADIILIPPVIITVIIIATILFAAVNLSMRRIKKLEPANAIRFGYIGKNKKMRRMPMLSNIGMDLAGREILLHPVKSAIKVMIILVLALMMFSVGLLSTVMDGMFTADVTIGVPNCDIFLQSNNTEMSGKGSEILEEVKKEKNIKTVIPLIMSTRAFASKGQDKISMMIDAFDSFSGDSDLQLIKGSNPKNDYEAAVSVSALKQLGKNIGDMVTMNIEGNESTYLITGSFQIISNNGRAARITTGAFKKANPDADYNWYAVKAKDSTDLKKAKLSLQNTLGDRITATIMTEFMDNMIGGIVSGYNLLSIIMIGVMALICGASLFNIIQIHVIESKRTYGIFKGLGMSNGRINQIQYIKAFLGATLGILIGFILTLGFAPGLLQGLLASTGLQKISYSFSVQDTLMKIGLVYLVVFASVFLAVRKHGKTNLRELIIE